MTILGMASRAMFRLAVRALGCHPSRRLPSWHRSLSPSSRLVLAVAFRQQAALRSDTTKPKPKVKTVDITFINQDGTEKTVKAKVGDTLLEVSKEFDIDVEGACEGTLSCSTCHLVVDPEWYAKIPDPLTEEEQDMLDLAVGLSDTSRLGCQILVSSDLEGIRLKLPPGTRDARNL